MQYLALATDYDGTLAHDSHVSDEALLALRRLKDSGRKVILVTGRELPELYSVFPDHGVDAIDRIVDRHLNDLMRELDDRARLFGGLHRGE